MVIYPELHQDARSAKRKIQNLCRLTRDLELQSLASQFPDRGTLFLIWFRSQATADSSQKLFNFPVLPFVLVETKCFVRNDGNASQRLKRASKQNPAQQLLQFVLFRNTGTKVEHYSGSACAFVWLRQLRGARSSVPIRKQLLNEA